jgi:hypothetical protein
MAMCTAAVCTYLQGVLCSSLVIHLHWTKKKTYLHTSNTQNSTRAEVLDKSARMEKYAWYLA